jgi:peptidyl-tRNA hydrolase
MERPEVVDYVLHRPDMADQRAIDDALNRSLDFAGRLYRPKG